MTRRLSARLRRAGLVAGMLVGLVAGPAAEAQQQQQADAAPKRVALVVGIAHYAGAPLPTPLNDAGLVARGLAQSGFAVTAAADLDRAGLDAFFQAFVGTVKAAGPDATVFVYLAGYGVQLAGDVLMIPADATAARDDDLEQQSVSVSTFARALEALPARGRVLVLDLAREHPFARAGRGLASGLPFVPPPPRTLVAANTAPGTVAAADVVPYGTYARALAEMLATPGLPLPLLFERLRARVAMATAGASVPWNAGSLDGLILTPETAPAPGAQPGTEPPGANDTFGLAIARDTLDGYLAFLRASPNDPQAPRVRTMVAARREAMFWSAIRAIDTDRAYWTYLRRDPRGPHVADARRRLVALRAALEPPPRFDIVALPAVATPQPADLAAIDKPFVTLDDPRWPAIPPIAEAGSPRAAFHQDLMPPPLAEEGIVPIAAAVAPRPGLPIEQPATPTGGLLVTRTLVDAAGQSTASSLRDGRLVEEVGVTITPDGDRTMVQTTADGTVISRATLRREKDVSAIVQTGPSGGILSRAVTRYGADGAATTVTTNGRNQILATVEVDRSGIATAKAGSVPARDLLLTLAADKVGRPVLAPPREPAAIATPPAPSTVAVAPSRPIPLTMPATALPDPTPAAPPAPRADTPATAAPDKNPPPAVPPAAAPAAVAMPAAVVPPLAVPMPPRRDVALPVRPPPVAKRERMRAAPVSRGSPRARSRGPRRRR